MWVNAQLLVSRLTEQRPGDCVAALKAQIYAAAIKKKIIMKLDKRGKIGTLEPGVLADAERMLGTALCGERERRETQTYRRNHETQL